MTSRSRMGVRRTQSGFTPVETLLLLLIAGILAIAVVPGLHRPDVASGASGKTLAAAAASALEHAHVQSRTFRVRRARLLERVPALRTAAKWTATGTRHTYRVQVTTADQTFSVRRTRHGRIVRTCRPVGPGCRGGRW